MDIDHIMKEKLSPSQYKGVNVLDKAVVAFSGAGSGKTRVLTYRIANIIAKKKALPHEILAITFTNKAANEMSNRIFEVLQEVKIDVDYSNFWINTFHAFGAKILRRHASLIGYDTFSILDKADQLSQIKRVMHKLNISNQVLEPKLVLEQINKAKRLCLCPDMFLEEFPDNDERVFKIYKLYEQHMKDNKSMDFADLLYKLMLLFEHKEVLKQYQEQFKFINVDEYQDTNRIQYLLLKKLLANNDKIFVVGDEDQSIYSWRGAEIDNILNLHEDFPNIEVVKLEENYRSTKTIVAAASKLISYNTARTNKAIFSNKEQGQLIKVKSLDNEYEEAKFVSNEIKKMGTCYDHCAVFYRTHAQSRVLEEQLIKFEIPYKIVGGLRFYERKEIKDIVAYFRLVLNPDDNISFTRCINTRRGLGSSTLEKLNQIAEQKQLSLMEATLYCINDRSFRADITNNLASFISIISSIQESNTTLSQIYESILDKTNFLENLKKTGTKDSETRIENLDEFRNVIRQFEDRFKSSKLDNIKILQQFLEEISLMTSEVTYSGINYVSLMTLHSSKGLEFQNVFMVGMEENMFPGVKAVTSPDNAQIEEERRLCYVGMTRACERLWFTHARYRRVNARSLYNIPSRFIDEIPKEYMDREERPKTRVVKSTTDYDVEDYFDQQPKRINKGTWVVHPIFGRGKVLKLESRGQKVSILFDDSSVRKFMLKYTDLKMV